MTKKTIFEFEVSTEENLHFQLNFLGLDLSERILRVNITERHSGEHKVTLSAPNVQLSGTGVVTIRYPKASMAGWDRIEYQADLLDETTGTGLRIMASRFKYDEPGRLVHGVKGASATIQWGLNEAVITAIGGVGPAGPVNVLTAGSIEVLAPDAEPEFTITGEAPEQQLHLKIPRGQPGFADKIGAEQARDLAFAHRNAAEISRVAASAAASAALAQRNLADAAAQAAALSATSAANNANTIDVAADAANTAATAASTSEINAAASAVQSGTSASAAATSATTSSTQAGVSTTKAAEAAASAVVATTKATNAGASETAAFNHKIAAEAAQGIAEASSASSVANKDAAITARTGAETARTGAEAARTGSETARDVAGGHAATASTHKDAAAVSSTASQDFALWSQKWASLLGAPVAGADYSAKHYAQAAAASAAIAAAVDPNDFVLKTSATGAAQLPVGPTADRGAGAAGWMRLNSETGKFEGFTSGWGSLGGGFFIGENPPGNPGHGDPWFHSGEGTLYAYYKPEGATNGAWIEAVPGFDAASFLKTGNNFSDLNNVDQALTNIGFGAFGKTLRQAATAAAARTSIGQAWVKIFDQTLTAVDSKFDVDLLGYTTLRWRIDWLYNAATADHGLAVRNSVDNGTTYRAGASDYYYDLSYSDPPLGYDIYSGAGASYGNITNSFDDAAAAVPIIASGEIYAGAAARRFTIQSRFFGLGPAGDRIGLGNTRSQVVGKSTHLRFMTNTGVNGFDSGTRLIVEAAP